MRRWICPKCGNGINGVERPRRDDVRRYCLDCSAETGRLVERTAPALERARAAGKERSAARTIRKRETERSREIAARSIGGIDLLAEAKRAWKLPTIRDLPRGHKPLPSITIRKSPTKYRSSGHCHYGSRDITVTAGTDPAYALGAVLHELVHAALGREGHSARFWSMLRSLAKEAWPEADFDFANGPSRGWACDTWIATGIRNHLAAKQLDDSTATAL